MCIRDRISTVRESLRTRLPLLPPKCFTDSRVALCWIIGLDKDWKPFVQKRVNEICEGVPVTSWSHCLDTLNPADLPSRGLTTEELSRSTLWRGGPDLSQIPENVQLSDDLPESCSAEMKAHTLISCERVATVSNTIEAEQFETLHKLYRVTAYVIKFLKIIWGKSKAGLTAQDLHEAELLCIKDNQLGLEKDKNFTDWKAQFGLPGQQQDLEVRRKASECKVTLFYSASYTSGSDPPFG